jgi:hypothetical protein
MRRAARMLHLYHEPSSLGNPSLSGELREVVRARQRFDLSDGQWAKIELLLPTRKQRTGRPAIDYQRIVIAFL